MLNEWELAALSVSLGRLRKHGEKAGTDPTEVIEQCEALGIAIITKASKGFPKLLLQLGDSCPDVLYMMGNGSLEGPMTAVVGSRRATVYGAQAAEAIGEILGRGGNTVVSGMARGIDSCAHAGALKGGGNTVAVLGCGVDVCYPPEARHLREEILKNGLLVSEYPPGSKPIGWHFPERNRIISGLCRETIVVEARRGSGSLITAHCAADQGRDVYAVPGSIFDGEDCETLTLLSEGASPLGRLSDVVKLCQLRPDMATKARELPEEIRWLVDFIQDFGTYPDEIARLSGRTSAEVMTALVKAKTCGAYTRGGDGKWYPVYQLLT